VQINRDTQGEILGWLLDRNLLDELRAADFQGMSLGEAYNSLPNRPQQIVRSASGCGGGGTRIT
jgi:hypothetical protein